MKITVLGSGTSGGVPVVGCSCPVCHSHNPKDTRLRASILVEGRRGECFIIDTGPDFRFQALRAGVSRLDAIFLTHTHADHLHGLDDVRPLSRGKPLPVYGNEPAIAELRERFSYVFKETQRGGGKPQLLPEAVSGPIKAGPFLFTPLPVKHGELDILGWYIEEGAQDPDDGGSKEGGLLYLTDTSAIPPATLALIKRPHTVIIGGLRVRPHPTHFTFEEALSAAGELGGRRVFLTHICHEHDHREIKEICEKFKNERNIEKTEMSPAWDGLTLSW